LEARSQRPTQPFESGRSPASSRYTLKRPRVTERIASGFASGHMVEILAGPGWGKRTAAQTYADSRQPEVNWVVIDPDEPAQTLARGLLDSGAASLRLDDLKPGDFTAAAARGRGLLVVEHGESVLGDDRCTSWMAAYVAAAVPELDILVLTSRHLGPVLSEQVMSGRCDVVTERDLSLTADEASELVEQLAGSRAVEVQQVLKATGGWIAGVSMIARFGPEDDPRSSEFLFSYLDTDVVGVLPDSEQHFLVVTSLLESVTVADSIALLGEEGEELWHRVRARSLPLVDPHESSLRYHAPLRAYLQDRLAGFGRDRLTELRRRYGSFLSVTGRTSDAVAWFAGYGEAEAARTVVESAVISSADRTVDWSQLSRWIDLVGEDVLMASNIVAGAMIRSLHQSRRLDEAVILIRQLESAGRMEAVLAADPNLLSVLLWTLHNLPIDAAPYLSRYESDDRSEAIRFMLAATSGSEPALMPLPTYSADLSPLIHWGLLWQGRLDEVVAALEADAADTTDDPNLILGALWSGQPNLAEQALELIPADRRSRPHALFAQAAMAVAAGDHERAIRMLRSGVEGARRTGALSIFEVLTAFAQLESGAAGEVVSALAARLGRIETSDRKAVAEWAHFVFDLARLQMDRPEEVLPDISATAEVMRKAKRNMLLAGALLIKAECELRLGDEGAARVSLAESRSVHYTSTYWTDRARSYCRALRKAGWLDEPQAATASDVAATEGKLPSVVELRPFANPPQIVVDGHVTEVRRVKVVELMADLALHPEGLDRSALQLRLFPDVSKARGGNHFRQIVFRLRELTGVTLDRPTPSTVAWPAEVKLVSSDVEFEQTLLRIRGSGAQPASVADELLSAIEAGVGTYLVDSDLEWVEQRRNYLSVLLEEAMLDFLRSSVEVGDIDAIRQWGRRILDLDPYNEEVYVLLMRAERHRGNHAACLAIYRQAAKALSEIGLDPGEDLVRLVQAT
jgi:ATP/maltotriose-dependent transcriptional regulator MalT/DNA-binding SARP family transcriptional activator